MSYCNMEIYVKSHEFLIHYSWMQNYDNTVEFEFKIKFSFIFQFFFTFLCLMVKYSILGFSINLNDGFINYLNRCKDCF